MSAGAEPPGPLGLPPQRLITYVLCAVTVTAVVIAVRG